MTSMMIFPSYVNKELVNDRGEITPDWNTYLDQLTTQLQFNFNREGYFVPSQNTEIVANLETPQSAQRLLVNSDTGDLLYNKNGTWINLTP
jgi:hypothetical protein